MDKQAILIDNRIKWRCLGICLLMCMMMCLWTGCDETMNAPVPSGKEMALSYNSDGIYGGNSQTVQWVVFAGNTETNKSYISTGKQDGASGQITIRGGRMLNDIYTVVNPDADLSTALAAVKDHPGTELEYLKSVQLLSKNLPTDASDPKVQRYHCYSNVCVQNNGTITYGKDGTEDIGLVGLSQSEYPMAKLQVQFTITDEASMTYDGEKLVIRDIQVEGPDYSYLLAGKKYDGLGYSVRDCVNLTPCEPTATSYTTTVEMPIPEYLRASDTAQKAQLIIVADRYKNGTKVGSANYKMPIGNAMDPNVTDKNDYDVNRDKIYKFLFTKITGGGTSVDDWVVNKQIGDWDEQKIPTQVEGANGFFLETTKIDNFRSFRMPRYVRFRSVGQTPVTVDAPRDAKGNALTGNNFSMSILWDGPDHKSGMLALKKGNWRTADYFTAYVKLKANNIEKVLTVNTVPTQYASIGFLQDKMYWYTGMNYTKAMADCYANDFNDARLIKEYSLAGGTGCADYYEGDENDPLTGKGCWRVSTIREGLWYLREKNIAYASVWAYEMASNYSMANVQSYMAKTRPVSDVFPAPVEYLKNWDLHDLDGYVLDDKGNNILLPGSSSYLKYSAYYRGFSRFGASSRLSILCVLDDKLDLYYNIGVNAADNPVDVTYPEAQTICKNLREGGYSDWRLPTAAESGYALMHGGTQGIPNNFDRGLYWLDGGVAAGIANPTGTTTPPGGKANVRCVRKMW